MEFLSFHSHYLPHIQDESSTDNIRRGKSSRSGPEWVSVCSLKSPGTWKKCPPQSFCISWSESGPQCIGISSKTLGWFYCALWASQFSLSHIKFSLIFSKVKAEKNPTDHQICTSQTLSRSQVTWGSCKNKDSKSGNVGWGLSMFIPNKFLVNSDVASLRLRTRVARTSFPLSFNRWGNRSRLRVAFLMK